jgi:hypothetical protein
MIQARADKNQDPISKITRAKINKQINKITNAKRAGGIAQVVQHLPSKCETLNSEPLD